MLIISPIYIVHLNPSLFRKVRKAQPVRRYKPMELKKSDVSLTVPQSPNFSDRFRL